MSDQPKTTPTHSASWHYERAEEYASLASFMQDAPNGRGAKAINTYDQALWASLANAHAQLAVAGAILLADRQGKARAELAGHVEGLGVRDVE